MTRWFRSFAQCGEDVLLWRALKGIERGFYIDIGAFDPGEDSVTRLFYDAGWRGINIEPDPDLHLRLLQKRPRDITLACALSDGDGRAALHVVRGTGLSTLCPEIAEGHRASGRDIRKITVATRRLDDIWQSHVPPGQAVHFLKIDAEGAEERIIRGADWSRHRPWIVMVEAVAPNSTTPSHGPWEPVLLAAGYVPVHFDGVNRTYVDKAHPELMEPLRPPLNFITDRYVPPALHRAQDDAAALGARCDLLQSEIDRIAAELATARDLLARRPRPLWERLALGATGAPRWPLRRALFDAAGQPRAWFRDWVLLSDGRPRMVFHDWMTRRAGLTGASVTQDPDRDLRPSPLLSGHAAWIRARLEGAPQRAQPGKG